MQRPSAASRSRCERCGLADRVELHKKDNRDKLWSYKIRGGRHAEFAFDPKTKRGLYVWFDAMPPTIQGVADIQDLSKKSNRTAIDRVFSGGTHTARYKATIATKEALLAIIDHFEGPQVRPTAFAYPEELSHPEAHTEGAKRQMTVNAYERSAGAREACILHYGSSCLACGFDFGAKYGPALSGYIHVHHIVPLETIGGEYKVDPIRDLVPLCPNCHATAHQKNPPYTVDEIKALIKNA